VVRVHRLMEHGEPASLQKWQRSGKAPFRQARVQKTEPTELPDFILYFCWRVGQDSNLQPSDPKSVFYVSLIQQKFSKDTESCGKLSKYRAAVHLFLKVFLIHKSCQERNEPSDLLYGRKVCQNLSEPGPQALFRDVRRIFPDD